MLARRAVEEWCSELSEAGLRSVVQGLRRKDGQFALVGVSVASLGYACEATKRGRHDLAQTLTVVSCLGLILAASAS